MEAFLAHYRVLSAAAEAERAHGGAPLNPEEREQLAAMERAIGDLPPGEREALIPDAAGNAQADWAAPSSGAITRRRQRAELRLRRVLAARGLLQT